MREEGEVTPNSPIKIGLLHYGDPEMGPQGGVVVDDGRDWSTLAKEFDDWIGIQRTQGQPTHSDAEDDWEDYEIRRREYYQAQGVQFLSWEWIDSTWG